MSEAEIERMITRAAEQGAKRARADVGLDGKDAALDIRDLRSLLECLRFVRRTAVQTRRGISRMLVLTCSQPPSCLPVGLAQGDRVTRRFDRNDHKGTDRLCRWRPPQRQAAFCSASQTTLN